MKNRNGFISNSSSSSFVINKEDISDEQILLLQNHINVANAICSALNVDSNGYDSLSSIWGYDTDDSWNIEVDDFKVIGNTIMDNFPISRFLSLIGITNVEWSDY